MLGGCAALGGAKETPAPTPTPRPTRPPRATSTPAPTPTPAPIRYNAGEKLSGIVLEAHKLEDGTTAFAMQSFWMEAIFLVVDGANITADEDGMYELERGARVIVRFAQDVLDEPPFSTTADEVKIVDYLPEAELMNLPDGAELPEPSPGAGPGANPGAEPPGAALTPTPEPILSHADPYFAVLQRLFKDDAEPYRSLKTVAVDLSRTSAEDSGPFKKSAKEYVEKLGLAFHCASDLELVATGVMNDEGYIDGGVYIALSDAGARRNRLVVTALRVFAGSTLESDYTLENKGTEQEAKWTIASE